MSGALKYHLLLQPLSHWAAAYKLIGLWPLQLVSTRINIHDCPFCITEIMNFEVVDNKLIWRSLCMWNTCDVCV